MIKMILKKIIATLIFFMFGFSLYAQSDTEIDKLIDSLSWKSITTRHSYHTFTLNYQDSAVKELLKIGKTATIGLLKAIKIPDKTVIIHIILTNIYEPDNGDDNLPICYIYKNCDDLIGWHHIYNGLIWEWYRDTDNKIEQNEIDKVFDYWNSRLYKNKKSWSNDIYKIFDNLHASDSLIYPCFRIYDNKSDKMELKKVLSLLGTKYPSNNFTSIFSLLGNDSIISKFNDCFFISYDADGIDFRFDTSNILTSIFIKEAYKGELPFGLKYSDTKSIVEQKIGSPDGHGTYVDNEWVVYNSKHIYLDYNKDKQIIKFVISDK